MSLLDRCSTLLRADAHGVIDSLEDRALLLRQHVRDAADALAEKRQRLALLEVRAKDLEAESGRLEDCGQQLEVDIDLALEEDQEKLARFSIKKMLPIRRRLTDIERQRSELESVRVDVEATLVDQESELEALRCQARTYVESHGGEALWSESVVEEEVDLELLRRRSAGSAA